MLFIDKVIEICENSKINGNVLIAKGEEILFQGSFGYSNIEKEIPFVDDSVFRVGSITKQFTAVSILQLVEKGLLKLEDSIDKFVDGVNYKHKVTIHHLLSNSSGIPNFDVFGNYDDLLVSKNFHERMVKEVILPKPLNFVPGERFEYSSSGFFILTHIIELISKVSYHQYLQDNIFKPLNMKNSGFHFLDLDIPDFASLYDLKDNKIVEALEYDMRKASGAGGMYSTVNDLYKWGRGLIENKLISQKYLDLMFKINTPISEAGGYGYGVVSTVFEKNNKTHSNIYHPGNGPGVFAQSMIIDRDIQLIVLSNVNDKFTFNECFNSLENLILEDLL
ncbi:MAG: hypothetical protein CVV60_04435 [Tenericutes bacterium HGW-Tenericutes-5]|nr:MAG: hypothetical protein CVV60_04435 [Tenericutes bacterium HGW-Tenericutes-5]